MIRKPSYLTLLVILGYCLTFWWTPRADCQEARAADITTQLRAYKSELAIDGTQVRVRLQLAKVYLQIEAYTEAVSEYQHVIAAIETQTIPGSGNTAQHRELSTTYYGLGLAYTGLEKFEAAITAYQRAITYKSDWAYTHAALASAYANLHRYTEALKAYEIAIVLDPDDEMIHHQLGNVHSRQGERAAAIRHQQQAIALAPEFAAAHYQLGLLYMQEKQWTDAIAAYQTAYTHDETLVEALYNLAQAHRRAGNTETAREKMAHFEERKKVIMPLQQLRGSLQRTHETTQRAQILANIGRLYLKDGFYEKAVWEYQKSLAMHPHASAYNGLGIAWTMLGAYSEAVAAQRKALELQPNFAKAYAGLGLAYFRQNETEAALKYYRRATDLDPQFLEAHLKIGVILLNQGRYAGAIDTYQTALKIKPDAPQVHHNLGLCYAHQAKTAASTNAPTAEQLRRSALKSLEKAVALSLTLKDSGTADRSSVPSPFLGETYYLIGELQASKRDFDAAETTYLKSGLPKAYHALARLQVKKVRSSNQESGETATGLENARRYAKEAIRLDSKVASYYNTLALIEFQRRDYLHAEKAIRKALALEPENRNYQHGLEQISTKLMAE